MSGRNYGMPGPYGQAAPMATRDPASGGAGWGPNGPPSYNNAQAALDPPSAYGNLGGQKVDWYREPVMEPRVFFPNDMYTAKQMRWRGVTVLNQAANTEVISLINIDIPSTVIAFTAAAVDTTGGALPVGLDSLDTFLVRYAHNSGDRLTPTPVLGSCAAGTGQFPCMVGAAGWVFNRGGSLEVGITPLRANLRITVMAIMVEIRSHQNYNPPG